MPARGGPRCIGGTQRSDGDFFPDWSYGRKQLWAATSEEGTKWTRMDTLQALRIDGRVVKVMTEKSLLLDDRGSIPSGSFCSTKL